jgi:SOS-response transcriptional repressor LexA
VPVLNRVRDGYPDAPPHPDAPTPIVDDHILAPGVCHPHAIAIRIVGDEMEPAYAEGDIVVGEPAPQPADGADCFVRLIEDGDTTFRRFYREGATVVRLQPVNSRHPPRIVDRADIARLWVAVRIVREVAVG